MEKKRRGRPAADYPYLCGPYRVRARWKLVIVTGRSGGRRASYNRSFDTREAAQVWAREFKRQLAAGGRTVGDAVQAYVERLKRKGNKPKSIETARHRLNAIFDLTMSLIDLNETRAQQLYDELVDTGVATDTHRGSLIGARAFCKWCVTQSWLRSNPFRNVQPVGRKSRGKAQLRVDEARVYMRHCLAAWNERHDRTALCGLFALMFSMRASEVSQLTARDIDDRGRVLRIAEHEAKTEDSRRAATVPPLLVPIMLELADKPATTEGHLFAKEDGTPADRHWVLYHARAHMRRAGVPVITAHGLRGTAATIGSARTKGAEVMADALGHTGTTMTKAHYIDAETMADAQAQSVADLLGEDGPE
jgi:integrase